MKIPIEIDLKRISGPPIPKEEIAKLIEELLTHTTYLSQDRTCYQVEGVRYRGKGA